MSPWYKAAQRASHLAHIEKADDPEFKEILLNSLRHFEEFSESIGFVEGWSEVGHNFVEVRWLPHKLRYAYDYRYLTEIFLIIAIDGPAASGKGTLARRLAAHYGLPHLDTGLTYRAVAHALMQVGLPLDNEKLAAEVAASIDLGALDRAVLSTHEIGEAASKVAVMGAVRRALVEAQRKFAASGAGAVLDGRDIGTVVCPDADVKLYVTATPEVRARRRHEEILSGGGVAEYEDILADIKKRDARDMNRADSPLKPAEDAYLIDTSEMDIESAFRATLDHVEDVLSAKQA